MKKFYKTFTFYFIIIGIIVVLLNVLGMEMIGLNPLLNLLDNSKVIREFMNSGNYLWYMASFITNIIYGVILDYIRIKLKK